MLPSGKRIGFLLLFTLAGPTLARSQRVQPSTSSEVPASLPVAHPSMPSHSFSPALSLHMNQSSLTEEPRLRATVPSRGDSSANQDQTLNFISIPIHIQVTKTPFATESSVPVANLLGERVQLDFSLTTLRNGNLILGPILSGQTLHPPPQTRSADLYGFGFRIPLGHAAQLESSQSLWRSVTRFARDEISP